MVDVQMVWMGMRMGMGGGGTKKFDGWVWMISGVCSALGTQ